MKGNKNTDILLLLLSFTKCQCENNIERTFFVSVGAQKGWETTKSGTTLPQYLPNLKDNFPVKFRFTSSIFVLIWTGKKAKTISLKVFKIMAFKKWQQETTKDSLRP